MYTVKCSWAGQAFASASASDSGGRKSRVRRSKEERKTMVETFIKRYQSLNNGNFPSLNLTHKEVGGSFYTVREIVREIIQENRVLGPGQFSSEKQKDDVIAMNYPLGTISSEPQGWSCQTINEVNGFSTQEGKETVVLNLDAEGKYIEHQNLDVVQYSTEHQTETKGEENADQLPSMLSEDLGSSDQEKASFESVVSVYNNGKYSSVDDTNDAHIVNHIGANKISEKSNNHLVEGSRESETSKVDGESEQMGAFQAKLTLPTEEMEVETFPLRPAVKGSDDSGRTSTNSNNFDGNNDDSEANKVSTLAVDKVSSIDTSYDLATRKVADTPEVFVSGGSPDMIIKDSEVTQESLPFKDDIAILHNRMNQVSAHGGSTSTAEQSNLQPRNASKGTTYFENNNGQSCENEKDSFKKDEKAAVGSSPLDRIDLESWRASKQETNPLLAFFRAFIDAFSKFWS